MKSKAIACAITVAALGFGSLAQAQQWQGHQWQGHQAPSQQPPQIQKQQQWQGHQGRHWQGQPSQSYGNHYAPNDQRRDFARDYGHRHYAAPQYYARGYVPHYYRGGYLPYEYRSHRYWVNDWRARHLAEPPYGYQWVETDAGDIVLVALATGLIASILLQ